jgi:alkylation response protein AidB-like acyl-CoA dehydrogenase
VQLVLTEDQEFIAKTAEDFVAEKSPISRVRELRDSADATGFSRELWKEMADLGWAGIPFAEELGGADLGMAEFVTVLEALGRTLAPEPFLSTVLLAGQALRLGGSESQQKTWLPGLIAGEKILALAYQERSSRYDLASVETKAEPQGEGFLVSGEKIQVLDGHVADAIIVSASTPGGVSLFLVPKEAPGMKIARQSRVDLRNAAIVKLDGVSVAKFDLVGEIGAGGDLLERVVDLATVGLCAEMLGAMSEALDQTLEHLKTRVQFDVPIGSFQALKHRAADMFIEVELCRSAVMAAARAVDAEREDVRKLISLAKARCSEAFILITNEAVQMFGGVGMTDEYDIGFYMKRARAAEMTFGDAAWHRDRWARLSGY